MIKRASTAAGLAALLAAIAAAAPVVTQLDWDSVVWPSGSLAETYTIGSGDVDMQWTGATGTFIQGTPESTDQAETGGLNPVQDALSVRVNFGGPASQEVVLTIDFTHPGGVTDVSFTVFDVDAWSFFLNPFTDQIQVTGTNAGGAIDPSNVIRVNPAVVTFDGVNTVTGQQYLAGDTSPDGNVTFEFDQPGITQIQVYYRSAPGAHGNPGQQYISIHDIDFTYDEPLPDLTVAKTVQTVSDPVNGGSNPKAIPGASATYTIEVTNSGTGPADPDSVEITDAIPPNTALEVTDFSGSDPGPVAFVDGATASGLTYTFTSLASTTDDVEFSNDGGATYTYTPADIGNGTDPAVTHIRVSPQGSLAASTGNDPSFRILFNVRVQ